MIVVQSLEAADERKDCIVRRAVDGGWELYFSGEDLPAPPVIVESHVPGEVTMRQAQRALLDAGLLDAVDAAINALPDPPRRAAKIDWEKSSTVRRDSQFVRILAPALGLTAAQLDELFVAASKIPV